MAEAYGVLMPMGFANRWTFYIGPGGKVRYIDKKVNVDSAGTDIATELGTLGVPRASGR